MAQPRERKNNLQGQWKQIRLTTVSKPICHDDAAPNIPSKSVIKFFSQTCRIALLNLIWRSLRTFYDPPSWNTPVHTKTVLWSHKWRKNLFTFSTSASSENENSFWNENKFSHMFPLFSDATSITRKIFLASGFPAAEFGDEKYF